MHYAVVAFLVAWLVYKYGVDSIYMHDYLVCKNHYAASRIREKRFEDRRIKCAFYCGQTYWCRAVTIYSNGMSVECHYIDGIFDIDGCNSFPVNKNVRLLIKKEVYVIPYSNGCYNGGSLSSGECNCVFGFSGEDCKRYIRDCKEGKIINLSSSGFTSVMTKPVNSIFAYEVLCNFQFGMTIVLLRNDKQYSLPFNRSWDEYKYSFGQNGNYWMGLESMYHMVNQPGTIFMLQVYCENTVISSGFSVYYNPFSMNSEASNYAITIGSFSANPGNEGSDGLGGNTGPMFFCTYDQPCSGLPDSNGGGWWDSSILPKMAYALTAPSGQIYWLYRNAAFQTDLLSITLGRL